MEDEQKRTERLWKSEGVLDLDNKWPNSSGTGFPFYFIKNENNENIKENVMVINGPFRSKKDYDKYTKNLCAVVKSVFSVRCLFCKQFFSIRCLFC